MHANLEVIKNINIKLYDKILDYHLKNTFSNTHLEKAKNGYNTLVIEKNDINYYLHSKYDPIKECEAFLRKYDKLHESNHILFIGSGLGYHIEAVLQMYPNTPFSIYEPNIEVLEAFLSQTNLKQLTNQNLNNIFTDLDEIIDISKYSQLFATSHSIITWPVTERLYGKEIQLVTETILEAVKKISSSVMADLMFTLRWTINALFNLKKTATSPNFFSDIEGHFFQGKPVVLVASGPSLEFELKNIQEIIVDKSAYVFALGSAINVLTKHNIIPHGVFTYDPTVRNQVIFEKIKKTTTFSVPLIFATTVGKETLTDFPGPLVNFLTSKDDVSKELLNFPNEMPLIQDGPSISIIALQILLKKGVGEIILVGQNFALFKEAQYASGVQYKEIIKNRINNDNDAIIEVESVDGQLIQSKESYTTMRKQFEQFTTQQSGIPIINTTVGGAKIAGTEFMPLSTVRQERLQKKNNIYEQWYSSVLTKDLQVVIDNLNGLQEETNDLVKLVNKSLKLIQEVEKKQQIINLNQFEKYIIEFESTLEKIENNKSYMKMVQPMLIYQFEETLRNSTKIRNAKLPREKCLKFVEIFGGYIKKIENTTRLLIEIIADVKEELIKETN